MRPRLPLSIVLALVVFAFFGGKADANNLIYRIDFVETSPGGGGPFIGYLTFDSALLQPNTTVRVDLFSDLTFTLYGITYGLPNFSDPPDRGFRTDAAGNLKPVVADLFGDEDIDYMQFTFGDGPRFSNFYFQNRVWSWNGNDPRTPDDPTDWVPCTGGSFLCTGTYSFTLIAPVLDVVEPKHLGIFGFAVLLMGVGTTVRKGWAASTMR